MTEQIQNTTIKAEKHTKIMIIIFLFISCRQKFKHIKNRAKKILKKGASANGKYEKYGRFGKTKRKRVR